MQSGIAEDVQPYRQPEHPIDAMFVNRWSPRAFLNEPIDDNTLNSVFEAARWAPSSSNEQPWRFIVAKTAADRERFIEFLMPGNQAWTPNVPVLIVIVAKKTFSSNGNPNPVATFDAGCAWGFLALAAAQHGLITHGMAGFNRDKAREVLKIPDDFDPVAVIALGRRGDAAGLSAELQAREKPSGRRPISETVMEGGFKAAA